MMECALKLKELPCNKSGVANVLKSARAGQKKIYTLKPPKDSFPLIDNGEYFYVRYNNCCNSKCGILKVISISEEYLEIESELEDDVCIAIGSCITYSFDNIRAMQDIAESITYNVEPPLYWNCETRTLSIDCNLLKNSIGTPCG